MLAAVSEAIIAVGCVQMLFDLDKADLPQTNCDAALAAWQRERVLPSPSLLKVCSSTPFNSIFKSAAGHSYRCGSLSALFVDISRACHL